TCSATISIPTQSDSSFSGTVTVPASGDCDSKSGTVTGVVKADGSVTAMAYASDGATVWEEAATRSSCTLVSSTPFTGTLAGNTLAVAGRSEEHTSELQSRGHLVCRLLLEKKNAPQLPNHLSALTASNIPA